MRLSHPEVHVDEIELNDRRAWVELWKLYLDFYGAELGDEITEDVWRRLLTGENVIGLAARRKHSLIGFAIVILHEATWSIGQTAYLEDLFVRADERGRGIGRKLIEEQIARARTKGCASVYWHTKATNVPARRLYDSFVAADDFVRYRLML